MLCVPCFVAVTVPCRALHDDVRDLLGNEGCSWVALVPQRSQIWRCHGLGLRCMTTEIVHLLVPCGKPVVMELPATAAAAAAASRPVAPPPRATRVCIRARCVEPGAPAPLSNTFLYRYRETHISVR